MHGDFFYGHQNWQAGKTPTTHFLLLINTDGHKLSDRRPKYSNRTLAYIRITGRYIAFRMSANIQFGQTYLTF